MYVCKKRITKFIAIILFVVNAYYMKASTLYVGLVVMCICYFIFALSTKKYVSVSKIRTIIIICIAGAVALFVCRNEIINVMSSVVKKISGEGTSGIGRLSTVKLHMSVFLHNFLFGVGYGTIRSYDLVSTWLAELGIFGMSLYLIYVIDKLVKLFKINTTESKLLFTVIFTLNAMMMIAMNEPYFIIIWVVYAIAEYIIWVDKAVNMYESKHKRI